MYTYTYTYVRVYTRLTTSTAGLFAPESTGTYVVDWLLINWLRRAALPPPSQKVLLSRSHTRAQKVSSVLMAKSIRYIGLADVLSTHYSD